MNGLDDVCKRAAHDLGFGGGIFELTSFAAEAEGRDGDCVSNVEADVDESVVIASDEGSIVIFVSVPD